MAFVLVSADQDFTKLQYTDLLSEVDEVLIEFGAFLVPKKTSIYNTWRSVRYRQIKTLTIQAAKFLIESGEESVIESSGFCSRQVIFGDP